MINTVIWINSARLYQSLWCEALHDGVFSDAQVQLVSAEQEPVVDGLSHQVYAGTHHKRDDAQVDSGARQRIRASLYELEQNIAWNKIYTEMLRVENRDATAASQNDSLIQSAPVGSRIGCKLVNHLIQIWTFIINTSISFCCKTAKAFLQHWPAKNILTDFWMHALFFHSSLRFLDESSVHPRRQRTAEASAGYFLRFKGPRVVHFQQVWGDTSFSFHVAAEVINITSFWAGFALWAL